MSEDLAASIVEMATDVGLTRTETAVVAVLLQEDRWYEAWEIGFLAQSFCKSPEVIKVHVYHIRQKLRGYGLKHSQNWGESIKSKYGFGYRLTADARDVFSAWNERRAA